MPCHVDEIPANWAKREVDQIVEVVRGKISCRNVGITQYDDYPIVRELVKEARARFKTFQYRYFNTTFVLVSPCPKGC